MTEQFDLDNALDLWIPLSTSPDGVGNWAHEQAEAVGARCDLDSVRVAEVAEFLADLAQLPWPATTHQRLVFLVHPSLGATVWDVSFMQPTIAPADVMASVPAGQLSSEVSTFVHLGVAGEQSIDFDLVPTDEGAGSDDQAISGRVVIALRGLNASRPVTVSAQAVTTHLESLMGSVAPMQYLLCHQAQRESTEQA